MLTAPELDRFSVVLVRARNPSNIGAVARAMHDFGFTRLRVVNEYPVPFQAAKSAVDASAVLAAAASYASVAEAVADCTLVVGTTAVGERTLNHPLLPIAAAAPRMLAELRRSPDNSPAAVRVALLFGSEKTGLSNDELSHCNWLLTIPMRNPDGARHVSMNLGQAAAVCLYELVRDSSVTASITNMPEFSPVPEFVPIIDTNPQPAAHTGSDNGQRTTDNLAQPATAAQLELITALLTEVMQATEYSRRHAHNFDPAHIRRLVRRIGADAIDAPVWIGILKQILWKLSLKPED
jgi:TrmH family RNA methyltransferase